MTIKKIAPEVDLSMSYGMLAYKTNGKPLVYFTAYKNHIGFYATPTGHSVFVKKLYIYKSSVQYPINKPMPLSLITKIIKFRVKENLSIQK